MSVKMSIIKAGDKLYDVRRVKAGNTTMSVDAVWEVNVCEVDEAGRWLVAKWNGNAPRKYWSVPSSWRRTPKEWVQYRVVGGQQCSRCYASKSDGHRETCDHPRAIAARKRREAAP